MDIIDNEDDGTICLGESFFVDRNYEIETFTFGSHILQLYCLHSASTDYDLTGQLVWPGAVLMNNYLSNNTEILEGKSIIELGSGIGITGILCSKFCHEIVLTDHNDEVLDIIKKNMELVSLSSCENSAILSAEKLEWGNCNQIREIIEKHSSGFDLILGADICFQQSSVPLLFSTVAKLFEIQGGKCKFILAYVSRAKIMDTIVLNECAKHGMKVNEVGGTRSIISNLEGVIFEISPS